MMVKAVPVLPPLNGPAHALKLRPVTVTTLVRS